MSRKIIVCIDGTNNEIGTRETNVLRLYRGLKKEGPWEGAEQKVHYIMGVGTHDGTELLGSTRQTLLNVLGQAFGYGLEDDVLNGYRYICQTYDRAGLLDRRADREKDRIYLVGFSRGAYGARMLAGFIHNFGLVTPDKLHLIAPVFRAYRRASEMRPDQTPHQAFRALRQYESALQARRVPIRALLLFDTVSSIIRFRRPLANLARHGSLIEYGSHPSVDDNVSVRIVLHALAIDERRSMFRPQFWRDEGPGSRTYYGDNFRRAGRERRQYVRQRWFPGYHSDVGGSAPEHEAGIGKLALTWMLDALAEAEAAADAEDRGKAGVATADEAARGLGFALYRAHRRNYWEGGTQRQTLRGERYSAPDPLAPIHDSHRPASAAASALWHLLEILPKSAARREPGRPGWLRRRLLWWYLPLKEPRRIPAHHEIDPSAWARYAVLPRYAPPALAARTPPR